MLLINKVFRVGTYIRLSREDGDKQESESIGNQRKIIERYAKENNLTLVQEYVDDGVSGTTFNRPGFNQMIEDIKAGKIDMVLTKDLSRLGREYIQTGFYIENFFPENNVRYVSILDGIDTFLDTTNNDITPFKAILNDMYAKDISKKIKSVIREKQKNGEYMCSTPPYGYKRHSSIKNKLVIDEKVADVVRKIFEMYDNGVGSVLITKYLNDNHYLPPRAYRQIGKVIDENDFEHNWNEVAIMAMLKNEVYIGNSIQNKRVSISYKVKKLKNISEAEQIRVNNTHEPIIDKDVFERVQCLAKARGTNTKLKYEYLFRGLLYCKHCGRKLQIVLKKNQKRQAKKHPYITCSDHKSRGCYALNMNYDKFETQMLDIIKQICKIYANKEIFSGMYDTVTKKSLNLKEKLNKSLNSIDKKIADINIKLDKMYMDKLNDLILEVDYRRYADNFIQERTKLLEQKSELENKIAQADKTIEDKGQVEEKDKELEKLINEFLSLEKIEKIHLYRLIDKIEIDKDKNIYIHFNFAKLEMISQNMDEFIEIEKIIGKMHR